MLQATDPATATSCFTRRLQLALWITPILVLFGFHDAGAGSVDGTAHAWPNGRTIDHLPAAAIDGSTDTWTWTTNPFTADAINYFAVSFSESANVNRIRLWKDPNCGSSDTTLDCYKNLEIQFTNEGGTIEGRTWTNVSNLVSGYLGNELFHAEAVNADGTVAYDQHAPEDGWGSLSFDPVIATGIRISFAKTDQPQAYTHNHYKLYELEVYSGERAVPTRRSTWGSIKGSFR